MENKKRIILCLDIDLTIMNSNAPLGLIDFNGSNQYGDASTWVNFLTEIKRYCEEQSFEFIVQIISSKKYVDDLGPVDNHLFRLKCVKINGQGMH